MKNFIRNYMMSDKENLPYVEDYRKIYLLKGVLLIGVAASLIFLGVNYYMTHNTALILFHSIQFFIFLAQIVYFHTYKNLEKSYMLFIINLAFYLFILVSFGNKENAIFIIIFLFPLIAYFFLGGRNGLKVSIVFLVIMMINLWVYYLFSGVINGVLFINITGIYLISMFIIHVYEKSRSAAANSLLELNATLHDRVQEDVNMLCQKDDLLLQQTKMASIGELMASISHQWKQPLSAIQAVLAKEQANKEFGNPVSESSLDDIKKSVDFMLDTMNHFRSFYSTHKEEKTFKVLSSLEKIKLFFKNQLIDNNVNLTLDIESDLTITGLENEFEQVIMNLLSNSCDALKNRKNPFITIKAFKLESEMILEFSDNAGGIEPSIADKIFEPYVTSKGLKGSGIGLYISQKIINEFFDGSITVEPLDNGTKFIVKLGKC